jgi:membrane associated rhomboid family serine protease
MMSPIVHADYLHLCVNLLGGHLVLSRVEEKSGWRQTLVVVCLSYSLHVCSLALITTVFAQSIDIMGLSTTVYTALGFYFKENLPNFSNKEKTSFVPFLILMLILDVAVMSIIVHLVALAFGFAVSSVMAYRQSKPQEINGLHQDNE